MKRWCATILVLTLLTALPGCGRVAANPADAVKDVISGEVSGELNETYSTRWFDFTVKSITGAYEYGGYLSGDGYKFIDVLVSETNTFGERIPMGYWDFELQAKGLPEEDSYPLDPLDETCMPEEFELADGETAEYHVLFTVPDEIYEVGFVYREIDEDDNVGTIFTIQHSLYQTI